MSWKIVAAIGASMAEPAVDCKNDLQGISNITLQIRRWARYFFAAPGGDTRYLIALATGRSGKRR
jgi:hypothetical protein